MPRGEDDGGRFVYGQRNGSRRPSSKFRRGTVAHRFPPEPSELTKEILETLGQLLGEGRCRILAVVPEHVIEGRFEEPNEGGANPVVVLLAHRLEPVR